MKKKEIYLPPQIKGYSLESYQVVAQSPDGNFNNPNHDDVGMGFWGPGEF